MRMRYCGFTGLYINSRYLLELSRSKRMEQYFPERRNQGYQEKEMEESE